MSPKIKNFLLLFASIISLLLGGEKAVDYATAEQAPEPVSYSADPFVNAPDLDSENLPGENGATRPDAELYSYFVGYDGIDSLPVINAPGLPGGYSANVPFFRVDVVKITLPKLSNTLALTIVKGKFTKPGEQITAVRWVYRVK